jgi:hypothetical protein
LPSAHDLGSENQINSTSGKKDKKKVKEASRPTKREKKEKRERVAAGWKLLGLHSINWHHRLTAWGVQRGRSWSQAARLAGGPPLKRPYIRHFQEWTAHRA